VSTNNNGGYEEDEEDVEVQVGPTDQEWCWHCILFFKFFLFSYLSFCFYLFERWELCFELFYVLYVYDFTCMHVCVELGYIMTMP
jgi:hypothetical protein